MLFSPLPTLPHSSGLSFWHAQERTEVECKVVRKAAQDMNVFVITVKFKGEAFGLECPFQFLLTNCGGCEECSGRGRIPQLCQ